MKKFILFSFFLCFIVNSYCVDKPLKVSVEVFGKSGSRYHAKIYIINQSKSNVTFWMWSCNISDSFVFNTPAIGFDLEKICDNNYLIPYDLSPNNMYVFKLDIIINDRNRFVNSKNIRLAFRYKKDRRHTELIWCEKPIKFQL